MGRSISIGVLTFSVALHAADNLYPIPSDTPLRVGEENFQERYLSLHQLQGVFVDFSSLKKGGQSLGIKVPESLYEIAKRRITQSGLRFLSEDEMLVTPGQPVLRLWPSYHGGGTDQQSDSQSSLASETACVVPDYCRASLWASFEQSTMLLRHPDHQFKLSTWGGGDDTQQCEHRGEWMASAVLDQIDRFVADYQKAQRATLPLSLIHI